LQPSESGYRVDYAILKGCTSDLGGGAFAAQPVFLCQQVLPGFNQIDEEVAIELRRVELSAAKRALAQSLAKPHITP